MTPARGEVWWVRIDPTLGSEIRKTRPALVLTADVLNRMRQTVVVVPLSTAARAHPPVTVPVRCRGEQAVAVVDQVRAVSRERLVSKIETASEDDVLAVGEALAQILELP
ncbi:MAG: type II toxin-antitoxin system PemK/MazF family toxin [Acidobacteria bacterium]|nr:MAG: type II toxin-antitoxin system PemK/MazF family toxin [Acidobacteriota bacterium]MCE7957193.1 type II toxin-antitoxin system PemK/MazF family toxin [Acidobacteria bacterium ACB2]